MGPMSRVRDPHGGVDGIRSLRFSPRSLPGSAERTHGARSVSRAHSNSEHRLARVCTCVMPPVRLLKNAFAHCTVDARTRRAASPCCAAVDCRARVWIVYAGGVCARSAAFLRRACVMSSRLNAARCAMECHEGGACRNDATASRNELPGLYAGRQGSAGRAFVTGSARGAFSRRAFTWACTAWLRVAHKTARRTDDGAWQRACSERAS